MTTIKEHCCGVDLFFDEKTARKQYRRYLKKGPGKVTTRMIRHLGSISLSEKSLLDIGGGIGALQWWFLDQGGKETTGVDASSGYLKQAEAHAEEHRWGAQARFVFGDFAEIHKQLKQANILTLDKVVCCYPEYEQILKAACFKSSEIISLSYPMDGILSRIVALLGVISARWKGTSFRPYIHPVSKIREVFDQHSWIRINHSFAFPWHVETYQKK